MTTTPETATRPPHLCDGDHWGRWTYLAEWELLEIAARPWCAYDLPLADVRSEADASRWISHIAAKRWATPADLDDLGRALRCWLAHAPGGRGL